MAHQKQENSMETTGPWVDAADFLKMMDGVELGNLLAVQEKTKGKIERIKTELNRKLASQGAWFVFWGGEENRGRKKDDEKEDQGKKRERSDCSIPNNKVPSGTLGGSANIAKCELFDEQAALPCSAFLSSRMRVEFGTKKKFLSFHTSYPLSNHCYPHEPLQMWVYEWLNERLNDCRADVETWRGEDGKSVE